MRFQSLFYKVTLAAVLLPSSAPVTSAQQPSQSQPLVTLSAPMRATLYPEVMHTIVPEWDRSYLLHWEVDRDPALVTMYDRNGKKLLEARVVPQDATKVSLVGSAVGATHAGGILAAGGGIMTDGSSQRFIAKTDPAGRTVQSVHTDRFTTRHVCEAPDGTVWAVGFDLDIHDSPDADKNILRHYSFEKGLLGSFVSLDSISKSPDAYSQVSVPARSYLRCGKDRVSVYLASAAQYFEVDASTGKLIRWSVDMSSVVGSKTHGFAVTDEGKIFVAFANDLDPNRERKHGLYELKATLGSPIAYPTAVEGTVTVFDSYETVPDGTFLRLWGADGNSLVVSRKGVDWGLSWANVFTASVAPE